MIRFSRPARQSAARSRDGYVWREAVAGVVAAYVVGVGAMAAGGIAGSGTHDGGTSGRPAFTDSSGPAIQGGVRGRAPAMPLFGGPAMGQSCFRYPASCYTVRKFRTAYGIQALLNRGIDGRGQTVVVPEVANRPPASPSDVTDIRQDLARFDGPNRIPAANAQVLVPLLARDIHPPKA